MINRVEIFDMDGVLACSMHRTTITEDGLLDLGKWLADNTPENVARDKVLPPAEYYKECLANPEVYTAICTVRELKPHDFKWIEENIGNPDIIIYPEKNVGSNGAKFKVQKLGMFKNLKQFKNLETHFHEDNITYLKAVCDAHKFTGHYHTSGYGIAGVTNVPENLLTA